MSGCYGKRNSKSGDYNRIMNISSGMGQLTPRNGGYPAYRFSKTGINVLLPGAEMFDRLGSVANV